MSIAKMGSRVSVGNPAFDHRSHTHTHLRSEHHLHRAHAVLRPAAQRPTIPEVKLCSTEPWMLSESKRPFWQTMCVCMHVHAQCRQRNDQAFMCMVNVANNGIHSERKLKFSLACLGSRAIISFLCSPPLILISQSGLFTRAPLQPRPCSRKGTSGTHACALRTCKLCVNQS